MAGKLITRIPHLADLLEEGTIQSMDDFHYLPDANRLGVLAATVLLAYALTSLIQTPQFTVELELPGFFFSYPFSLNTIMVIITSCLTATGMDWLLRGHPTLGDKRTIEHWLLPTLTTFIIGIPLSILPSGGSWWIGFGIGSLLLIFVYLAEYIVVDPSAPTYALASAGLTALSYGVYMILTSAMHYGGARLFLLTPAVFIVSGLMSLRILHLRLGGKWQYHWALGIALVSAQFGAGLHYWPISPVQYGLALLGPLYALTTLAGNLLEKMPIRQAAAEPIIALGIAWGGVVLLR